MPGKERKRRPLGSWILAGFLLGPFQNPRSAPSPRVWIVPSGKAALYQVASDALLLELKKRGIDARQIPLEYVGRELEARKAAGLPAACVAVGTKAALRLRKVLPAQVLFSFCLVSHPRAMGLLRGRSCLGIAAEPSLSAQVALVGEALPWVRRLGLLYSETDPASKALRFQIEEALPEGWSLDAVKVEKFSTKAKAIEALLSLKPDLIWTFPDPAVIDLPTLKAVLLGALRKKIPVFGFSAPLVRSGALLGTYLDPTAQARLLGAELSARLLRRSRKAPGEEEKKKDSSPGKEERKLLFPRNLYAVNLNVALRLDITFPEKFLKGAKIVYGGRKKGGSP